MALMSADFILSARHCIPIATLYARSARPEHEHESFRNQSDSSPDSIVVSTTAGTDTGLRYS
jgi:hypothetical protein